MAQARDASLIWPACVMARPECQRIARVAQGLDRVQRLQLLAQAAHHDVHRAGVQLGLVATQVVQDVVAAEDLAWLAGQQQQQVKLGAGQLQWLALR
jgi:hypothetical protein